MIKLMVFIFFIVLLAAVAYESVQDAKLKQMDGLVERGISPEEAFKHVYKE